MQLLRTWLLLPSVSVLVARPAFSPPSVLLDVQHGSFCQRNRFSRLILSEPCLRRWISVIRLPAKPVFRARRPSVLPLRSVALISALASRPPPFCPWRAVRWLQAAAQLGLLGLRTGSGESPLPQGGFFWALVGHRFKFLSFFLL